MTELQKKKLQSRRFWVVIWACLLVTIWGSMSLILGITQPWLVVAMNLLVAIPASYVTITTIKKKEAQDGR